MSKFSCEDGFEIDFINSSDLHRHSMLYRQYIRRLDMLFKLKNLIGKDGYNLLAITLPNEKCENRRGVVILQGDHGNNVRFIYSSLPKSELLKKENVGRIADFLGSDWIDFLYSDTARDTVPGKVMYRHMTRGAVPTDRPANVLIDSEYTHAHVTPDDFLQDDHLANQVAHILLSEYYDKMPKTTASPRSVVENTNHVIAKLQSSRYTTHVAFKGKSNTPAAVCLVQNDDPDTLRSASICGLGVDVDHEGKGLRETLVKLALYEASKIFKSISCVAVETDAKTKKLLKDCGFTSIAKTISAPRLHNGLQPKHRGGNYKVYYTDTPGVQENIYVVKD